MIALLLAQLVIPSPSVEPLEPSGMICMGECSDGPMVWRASPVRGRLVVACDMRSDTCSDGRKIVTERATPVPCEVSPGVWEMVGVDEGCYSVRGLESWAANTSYLSWGAELDRGPWGSIRGGTLERVSDGWRVSNDPAQANSGWVYTGGPAGEGTTYTVACRVRADVPTTVRLNPLSTGGSSCPLHTVTPEWTTVSCTRTAVGGEGERAHIWPGVGQEGPASVIVAGCWLTRTSTPGRPCWGGEAPVTCAGDWHTISTEGWPTESGEISVTVTVGDTDSTPVIIDGRATSGDVGPMLYVTGATTNSIGWQSDSVTLTAPNVIERHKTHRIVAGRRDGRLYLVVDGVRHEGPEAPPLDWQGEAILGRGRVVVVYQGINGSISSLRVRSFE